jgi:hypothetical protein
MISGTRSSGNLNAENTQEISYQMNFNTAEVFASKSLSNSGELASDQNLLDGPEYSDQTSQVVDVLETKQFVPSLSSLPILNILNQIQESKPKNKLEIPNIVNNLTPDIKKKLFPNQLTLESGVVFWDDRYNASDPDAFHYQSALPSF